jgi:hypothetical protein
VGKPSKRKYLVSLLERTLHIQAHHPHPETFEELLTWIGQRLEAQPPRKKKKNSR